MNFQKLGCSILLIVIIFCQSCEENYKGGNEYSVQSETHMLNEIRNDKQQRFKIISSSISPNDAFVYYQYVSKEKTTALDSLINIAENEYWAVVKNNKANANLTQGRIPSNYTIKGWTNKNELILLKNAPKNMHIGHVRSVKTGDFINGVKVIIPE